MFHYITKGIFSRDNSIPVLSKQVHVTFDRWHMVCHTTYRPVHQRMRIPQNSAHFLASDDASTSDTPVGSLDLGHKKIPQNMALYIDEGDGSKAAKKFHLY